MKTKIKGYSEEQLVAWAADYYDNFYGGRQVPQEAEIKDANIDVPEQDVAKAQETLRQKFEYVYDRLKEDVDDDSKQQELEDKTHTKGFLQGAASVAAGFAVALPMLSSGVTPAATVPAGLAAAAFTAATVAGFVDTRRHKKKEQAEDLGLSITEFDILRKHEKAILKFTKEHGRAPTPEDDAFGSVDYNGHGKYYLYLYMKMLQHKGLMVDKTMNKEAEVDKEEE